MGQDFGGQGSGGLIGAGRLTLAGELGRAALALGETGYVECPRLPRDADTKKPRSEGRNGAEKEKENE